MILEIYNRKLRQRDIKLTTSLRILNSCPQISRRLKLELDRVWQCGAASFYIISDAQMKWLRRNWVDASGGRVRAARRASEFA